MPAGADVVYVERVRGSAGAALLDQPPAVTHPPLQRRQGLAAFNPAMVEYWPARRSGAEHGLHDRRHRSAAGRWNGSAARLRSVDETELGLSVARRSRCRVQAGGPVVAAISMVGPSTRVIGDHETHHAVVLQAAAGRRTSSESITSGEYSLRRRRV